MHVYLVCFDISDDRIRYRVDKCLGSYGDRVQKSVFEISVKTKPQFKKLQTQLEEMIDVDDKLFFYHLCYSCRKKSVDTNNQPLAQLPAAVIV